MEGLVDREARAQSSKIQGVQRSEEQQARSTEELNNKLIEKESRRAEESAVWSRVRVDRHKGADSGNAVICAREMEEAMLSHPHEPELGWYYEPGYFVDDVRGGVLDKQSCIEARRLEMQFFRKMGVYRKMKRADLPPGAKVITTKWVDTNKGSDAEPNYRSRLVGREIKTDERPDLFAATPPLESLRYVLSLCASSQHGPNPHRILTVDVKRAYFYAPARRPIYIELPVEDRLPGEEDLVAQLNLSLYGTRDAAQNWTKEYTRALQAAGFVAGKASPCNFFHEKAGMALSVHGDDFTVSGPERSLEWFRDFLNHYTECQA